MGTPPAHGRAEGKRAERKEDTKSEDVAKIGESERLLESSKGKQLYNPLIVEPTDEEASYAQDKLVLPVEKETASKIEVEPERKALSDGLQEVTPVTTDKRKLKSKKAKRGVIYLSRLPPNIEITSVRTLLSRMGTITNMWLRPETREQQKQRLSLGGSRRRTTFRDGWVEYSSRRDARETVQLLNGRPMTGAKRKGRWANDLWCMKFLPGFEWRHLTAEIFGGRERILRVREEMAAARQQRNWVEERSRLAEQFKKKGEVGDDIEPIRRFLQKRPVPETAFDDDYDEKRAKLAAARVDEELDSGKQAPALSEELIKLLVKTEAPKS
ncbi:activator of basal transcription 1 [Gracilaria domingensis]|nr:activator of basal transcription 1 [Gracilaria domingensis]